MKVSIGIGVTVGSILGGWLGSMIDGGSMFGVWGILGSTIGGLAGIYVGYKLAQYFF